MSDKLIRADILGRIRQRQDEMAALGTEADRTWWRFLRSRHLRSQAMLLHYRNEVDFAALRELEAGR